MNSLWTIIVIISTLSINDISAIPGFENRFTLHGQVIYPSGSRILIEPDSQLIIELQDISVTDDLATTITRYTSKAVVFPVMFDLTYSLNQVIHRHIHVLNAKIINKYNDILFANEKRIEVKLLGAGRTTFIDIPVVPFQQYDLAPMFKSKEWPELIGKNGNEVVDIIKKDTGFEQVFVVTDGTKVTKDLRYDRVCVYVDKDGKVMHIPRTG